MPLSAEQRAEIVRAAKEWIGTPYHHHGKVKGAGADCAMFPLAVYQGCGLLPCDYHPPQYSVQWHLHRSDELYLNELKRFCAEVAGPPQPGDLAVFRFGRTFSHGAIVLKWPQIIHSYIPHGVLLGDGLRDGELAGRAIRFFQILTAADERAKRNEGESQRLYERSTGAKRLWE